MRRPTARRALLPAGSTTPDRTADPEQQQRERRQQQQQAER